MSERMAAVRLTGKAASHGCVPALVGGAPLGAQLLPSTLASRRPRAATTRLVMRGCVPAEPRRLRTSAAARSLPSPAKWCARNGGKRRSG